MVAHRSFSLMQWLCRMVIAVAAVASWSSAQAAAYQGIWDPPYGSVFGGLTNGLGWRGTATYFVPDSCEISGSGLVDNHGNLPFIPGNCGGLATVTSARVELFDVSPSSDHHTLATLTFDPTSFYVAVLRYAGGQLIGLQTDFSNLLTPASDPLATSADLAILDSFGPLNSWTTQFSLSFNLLPSNRPSLAFIDCSRHDYYQCIKGINSSARGFQPEFTITRIPEPGTLALAGLALLTLRLVRRRA
jgi:hypothetical protein